MKKSNLFCFFHLTQRILDLADRESVNLNQLYEKRRLQCLQDLAKLYSKPSKVKLTQFDYENIYDIAYLLCDSRYDTPKVSRRIEFAKEFVEGIKRNDRLIISKMVDLITYI